MNKRLFQKVYYKGEFISANAFWKEYYQDKDATLKKYKDNIFCPSCKKAILLIVQGTEYGIHDYFRTKKGSKHDDDCEFIPIIEKKDIKGVKQETIEYSFNRCIKKMRNENSTSVNKDISTQPDKEDTNKSMVLQKSSKKVEQRGCKNLNNYYSNLSEYQVYQVYYGKFMVYLNGNNNQYFHFYDEKNNQSNHITLPIKNKNNFKGKKLLSSINRNNRKKIYLCFYGRYENKDKYGYHWIIDNLEHIYIEE